MIDWYRIRTEEEHAEAVYRQAIAQADADLLAGLYVYAHSYELTTAQAGAKVQVLYAADRASRLIATDALHIARRRARS